MRTGSRCAACCEVRLRIAAAVVSVPAAGAVVDGAFAGAVAGAACAGDDAIQLQASASRSRKTRSIPTAPGKPRRRASFCEDVEPDVQVIVDSLPATADNGCRYCSCVTSLASQPRDYWPARIQERFSCSAGTFALVRWRTERIMLAHREDWHPLAIHWCRGRQSFGVASAAGAVAGRME